MERHQTPRSARKHPGLAIARRSSEQSARIEAPSAPLEIIEAVFRNTAAIVRVIRKTIDRTLERLFIRSEEGRVPKE
jgi:hypothetical protein